MAMPGGERSATVYDPLVRFTIPSIKMLGTWGFNLKVQQNSGFSTTRFINRDHHQQDAAKKKHTVLVSTGGIPHFLATF